MAKLSNVDRLKNTNREQAIKFAARESGRIDAILADHRLGSGLSGPAAAMKIADRKVAPYRRSS